MSALDWGSVPTWFSAIGTTGSLTAAITIIVRDRRKDRREDAARVACWLETKYEFKPASAEIVVHNAATRPVFDVRVIMNPGQKQYLLSGVVKAGAEERFPVRHHDQFEYAVDDPPPFTQPHCVAVTFRDVESAEWRYDLKHDLGALGPFRDRRYEAPPWWRRQLAIAVRLGQKVSTTWRRRAGGGVDAPLS